MHGLDGPDQELAGAPCTCTLYTIWQQYTVPRIGPSLGSPVRSHRAMMWDLVLLLAAAGCCCRADAALASTSTTPRPCVGAADIDPTGRQPGMVGAVRLSHLGPGLMGVTFSTPNHTLSITPRYRAIVHWGTRPDKLDHNSTTSPIDVDKAEVGAVHRCNGVNPAPPGAVQGPWEHYLAMDGLVDNQTYYYRVGDAGEYGLSSVRRFRSAPAVDGDATTLSLVLSDMGEFNWSASTVNRLVAMAESDEYDLLMHNGDISYADNRLHINEGTQYIDDMNSFFANISCFSALRPYMMTVGNHEAVCASFCFLPCRCVPVKRRGLVDANCASISHAVL